MKKKSRKVSSGPQDSGSRVLDIPLEHLHPDPHQPRKQFDPDKMQELVLSLDINGLQQEPKVNLAYVENGVQHYYLKTGERRWRAHQILRWPTMRCVVEPVVYDAVNSLDRKLRQAAENTCREDHTHGEIVALMEEVVQDELEKKGGHVHGVKEIALRRVARAFGKSRAWAENYYDLTHLHPELRAELDFKNPDERLSFNSALGLSRAPPENQKELLGQANQMKQKGGHALMHSFIVRHARLLREQKGGGGRARKPSDDKALFQAAVRKIERQALAFCSERKSGEFKKYLADTAAHMSTTELDPLLHKLAEGLMVFEELRDVLKARRDELYKGLRVVG